MRIASMVVISLAGLVWIGGSPAIAQENAYTHAQERAYTQAFGPLLKRADCDHSCLQKLMEKYLDALVAHDPSRLPLAEYAKFTENTVEMPVGDGLWKTADSVLPQRIIIADPTTAQVMCFGAVMENGRVSLLFVRLKERAGRITQIETVVIRKMFGNYGTFTALQGPFDILNEVLPPSQRRSRQELIALANQYYQGIEQSNGDIVPFASSCERWENNSHAAGGSPGKRHTTQSAAMKVLKGMTIREEFNTHLSSYIVHVTDRRYPIVDVKRGLVTAIVMFQHPGNVRYVDVPGHGRVKLTGATSALPNTSEVIETFRIKNGRIVDIYAYDSIIPYREKPGW